jgi:transcriptional regulator with XRE-family HTH domain
MADINDVGARIAHVRNSRGLTIDQLAERSQLSTDLIREIENGALIPSLAPLIKIARALGVRLGTFMDDMENIGPVVTRKGQPSKAVRFAEKSRAASGALDFYSLAMDKNGRHMDPFLIDVLPASDGDYPLSAHEGEEFIYVIGGRIEICYGKDRYQLSEGDSIYYDSTVAHNVHALDDVPARILAVVYAPF